MSADYYMQGAGFVPDGPWWAWVIILALIAGATTWARRWAP